MRILLNANLGREVQRWLRVRGHDVERVQAVLGPGIPDPEVARFAAIQRRHLITLDMNLYQELVRAEQRFPLALVSLRRAGLADASSTYVRLLERLLAEHPDWIDGHYYIVTPGGVRIRNL